MINFVQTDLTHRKGTYYFGSQGSALTNNNDNKKYGEPNLHCTLHTHEASCRHSRELTPITPPHEGGDIFTPAFFLF